MMATYCINCRYPALVMRLGIRSFIIGNSPWRAETFVTSCLSGYVATFEQYWGRERAYGIHTKNLLQRFLLCKFYHRVEGERFHFQCHFR